MPEPFNPQSLNRYSYTLNNPINYIDPSGFYYIDRNRRYIYESEEASRRPNVSTRLGDTGISSWTDPKGYGWRVQGNPIYSGGGNVAGFDYSWFFAAGVRDQVISELYPPQPEPVPPPAPQPQPEPVPVAPQPTVPMPTPAPLSDPVPEIDIKPPMNYWHGAISAPIITPYGVGMITMPISIPAVGYYAKEHTDKARGSTKDKHQKGQARRKRDRGMEKGDINRRPSRKRPIGWKGPWPRLD